MEKIRLIAKLEINNDYVVKGKHFEGLRRVGKPNDLALKYYLDSADEIIFLDAVASLYDRNSLINIIKEASKNIFIPITVGGGIRTLEDISLVLNAGADKVAINTQAVKDISFLKQAIEEFGSQAIVSSIVARKNRNSWEVFIDNAKHRTYMKVIKWAQKVQDVGVGEIMISSIDKDGLQNGFDFNLVKEISKDISIPLIVSSGAGSLKDIYGIAQVNGCDAIALSSVLHYNKFSIKDIKNYLVKYNYELRL